MAEEDLTLGVVIGLLVGIPLGIIAGWVLAQHLTGGSSPGRVTYSNVEEWEIVKDGSGRTRGVRVHRTAKEA